jgi:excisionase family DNA binding protein
LVAPEELRADDPNRLYTVGGAAEYLQLHPKTIYAMTAARTIGHVRVGRSIRFRQEDLDRYLEAARGAGTMKALRGWLLRPEPTLDKHPAGGARDSFRNVLEVEPDEVLRPRLECFRRSPACPVQPGLAWACRTCGALQLGHPIDDDEAEREVRFLAAAEAIWSEQDR